MPLNEKALIARIRRQATSGRGILTGIGDDCAVLRIPPGHQTLVTTDFSLEGVHFRRDWHSPESVGHRCLARGLSDIAAMGGEPVAVFLSLALPKKLPQAWVDAFMRGLLALARKSGATLAGGDTAQSYERILADIMVLGQLPAGKAILRSGAKPGDRIYVSGQLGGSAEAIRQLRQKPKSKLDPRYFRRHNFPEPRLALALALRRKGLASAMIDLSDGLSTDLAHICEESGVGAELQSAAIPRAVVGGGGQQLDLRLALHGGEDYELLFTAPSRKRVPSRIAGVAVTQIGRITPGRQVLLVGKKGVSRELVPQGWEHFGN